MKKTIISLTISLFLFGCAESENIQKEKEYVNDPDQTKELFYDAFVGNLMEKEGQNNNAIKYYENILEKQYDKKYFSKLIDLYYKKNDFIGANNLIKNTEGNHIYHDHKDLIIVYEILNERYDSAVNAFLKELAIVENQKNKVFELSKYYHSITPRFAFLFQDSNQYKQFLNELNEKDKNKMKILENIVLNYQTKMPFKDIKDIAGIEKSVVKINVFLTEQKNEEIEAILLDSFLNNTEKNMLINNYFSKINKVNDYQKAKELMKLCEKHKLNKNYEFNYNSFYYYYNTFNYIEAIHKLDKIKDKVNQDFYYHYKGLTNYMLGYKKASKKYFIKVKNQEFIKNNIYVYTDVLGFEVLDNNEELKELETFNKSFIKFQYYIRKKDKNNSKIFLEETKNEINKKDNSSEFVDFIKGIDELYYDVFDQKESFKRAKAYYMKDPNIYSANSYIYSGLKVLPTVTEDLRVVFEKYKEEFSENTALIDTKAYYLFKIGNPYEALTLYKEHNLLFIKDNDIQQNIAEIYKAIGNEKEYKKHLKYAEYLSF